MAISKNYYRRLLYVSALLGCLSLSGCSSITHDIPERGFWSESLVKRWEHGMVSGNGTTGALVYGTPLADTIIFSNWDIYMPLHEPLMPVNTASHLDTIRKMLYAGMYGEASEFVVRLSREEGYGSKRWTDPFVPGFDLIIRHPFNGEPANYRRSVNFMTGEIAVSWEDDAGQWMRRVFVSRADSVAVVSISNLSGRRVDCEITIDRRPLVFRGYFDRGFAAGDYQVTVADDYINYTGAFLNKWEGSLRGCEGVALVRKASSAVREDEQTLKLSGRREVLVLVKLGGTYEEPGAGLEKFRSTLESLPANYETLLRRHSSIHGELFRRVKIDLTNDNVTNNTPIEKLLSGNRDEPDLQLISRQFDAGRYNILSSTGMNPPNLQGIWAGSWASDWSGDYTQNGNLQVAISSIMPGNMTELMHAYFRYQLKMMDDLRENAMRLYGARGIYIASRTSTHGLNNHFDRTWPMTFWTAGAGWAAGFFYDYWLYTGDTLFLKEKALPFMREAALFYEDFLVRGDDGHWIFIPSYSPENNPAGSQWQACINATMDVMVARQLLKNTISAARATGDTTGIAKWTAMLSAMPPYQVNEDGALREWMWPGLEDNYSHRHASHLYALFEMPDRDIMDDPLLREAARIAVERRMEERRKENGGIMAFGMVQLAMAAASLGEGEMAWEAVRWLSRNYWTPSLVTTHDPGHIFNLDLSGGFPALIIRMLVSSEPGRISLLPAIPGEWTRGSAEGLLLRGGITLDRLEWHNDTIKATLLSVRDQVADIYFPGKGKIIYSDTGSSGSAVRINLTAGVPISIGFVAEVKED